MPEGLFRISASKNLLEAKLAEIQKNQFAFNSMDQLQRADLLKTVLRELQKEKVPLFSSTQFDQLNKAKGDQASYAEAIKHALDDCAEMNKKIAFCLFSLLNNASKKAEATKMPPSNLALMIAPNVFEPSEDPMKMMANLNPQKEIISDLITRAAEIAKVKMHLQSTHYEHEVQSEAENRFHVLSVSGENLKEQFQGLKGDLLKSKILLNFKEELEQATSDNIEQIVKSIKSTQEYKVLEKSQGLVTLFFGLKTSSVKAFDEMVAERKNDLELEKNFGLN
ncbi:RhoGAP domain-containing protein [Legionella saoudiensis]|uniref:RhoGAP domain-containing protein n=1 Tax=Legionella saoudiensis TaxID=1750561 RepID=UPI0018C1E920|nr:RhoGAP domain-containing protein [Legionella saoudiensis]